MFPHTAQTINRIQVVQMTNFGVKFSISVSKYSQNLSAQANTLEEEVKRDFHHRGTSHRLRLHSGLQGL